MTGKSDHIDTALADGRLTITVGGAWTIGVAAALETELRRIDPVAARSATIDLSGLQAVDSTGALLLARLRDRLSAGGRTVDFTGMPAEHVALIQRVIASSGQTPPRSEPYHPLIAVLVRTGRATVDTGREALGLLNFIGLVAVTAFHSLARPGKIRFISLVSHLEQVGFNALPIIGLLSFLIGVVVAFQGADQLRRFGAEIFTVNLLGVSILREMGVLLTAIVVAGRSGSAFAAQIGTMQVNQEIDAMRTLGLDPVEILVLPRVLALVLAMPLLAVYADIMGLIGGAAMSMGTLDISIVQFVERLHESVGLWTFWVGVIKAPVFGYLIALIGCHEGLKVTGSAESVGRHTTRSVVIAIFLVILADAAFSILFSVVHV